MSFFIAKLDLSDKIVSFLSDIQARNNQPLVDLEARIFLRGGCVYWLNVVKPKIPPIYYLSIVFAILMLLFGGWGWIIPITFFAATYLSFWKGLHIYAFKKGLRKKGYTGNIKILNIEQGITEAIFD